MECRWYFYSTFEDILKYLQISLNPFKSFADICKSFADIYNAIEHMDDDHLFKCKHLILLDISIKELQISSNDLKISPNDLQISANI